MFTTVDVPNINFRALNWFSYQTVGDLIAVYAFVRKLSHVVAGVLLSSFISYVTDRCHSNRARVSQLNAFITREGCDYTVN